MGDCAVRITLFLPPSPLSVNLPLSLSHVFRKPCIYPHSCLHPSLALPSSLTRESTLDCLVLLPTSMYRKVDTRLLRQRNSNSNGARPVRQMISMIQWFRSSRFSNRNSLPGSMDHEAAIHVRTHRARQVDARLPRKRPHRTT